MFCPSCEEDSPGGTMCLVCGDVLTSRPTVDADDTNQGRRSSHPSRERRDDDEAAIMMAMLATSTEPSLSTRLLRESTNGGVLGRVDFDDLSGMSLPREALDPQAGTARSRPASRTALDGLRRTVLAPESAELFEARVSLFEPRRFADPSWSCAPSSASVTLNAVPGEFVYAERGPQCESLPMPRAAAIVVCSPRTVKGGVLSARTLSEIASLRRRRVPFVAYVERGDGVTFVQKALACQRAGETSTANNETLCVGVIVGNATSGKEIWPYVMQDTKEEAKRLGLKVPVVMVRRDDGIRIVRWSLSPNDAEVNISGDTQTYAPCHISILSKEANSHTCPVCTDSYVPGDTIVRLPLCGHVFHEACALTWLMKHNTCPYCRKELPTDDDDYERERRRREADSERNDIVRAVNGHDFYG